MQFEKARDVEKIARKIVKTLSLRHLDKKRIYYYRSFGSKSKSIARIWGLPRLLQLALKNQPAYVIEVLASRFDRLNLEEKERVLIHEFLHIPKNFSGSLLAHRGRNRNLNILVNKLFKELKKT